MRDATYRLKSDAVRTMASRFASLPDYLRLEVAGRLLNWYDEHQDAARGRDVRRCCASGGQKRASLLEKFWDEVEKTHGDGFQCCNPFAAKG